MTRKQFSRLVALIIIILFFTITFLVLSSQDKQQQTVLKVKTSQESIEVPALERPNKEANVTLGDFKRNFLENGKVKWELEGKTANIYNQDNFLEIVTPNLTSYQNPKDPVNIKSKQAYVKFNEKELEQVDLKSAVEIITKAYTITTEEARFNQKSNQVFSPKFVTIINQKNEISGTGFSANLNNDQIKFKNNVHSKLLDSEKEPEDSTKKTPKKKKKKKLKQNKKDKMEIRSQKLFLDNQNSIFSYENNVDAIHGDTRIKSDKLDGLFNENQEIEFFDASGHVQINNPKDKLVAAADKANFRLTENLIILTGSAVLTKEKNQVIAEKIIYNTLTKRSEAVGEAEVKILNMDSK